MYKAIYYYYGENYEVIYDYNAIQTFETAEDRNEFMVDQMFCNDEYSGWECLELI